MESLASFTFAVGVVAYSVASTLFFLGLTRAPSSRGRSAGLVLWVAVVLHFAQIVVSSLLTRICPVESLHFSMSLAALLAVVVFLLARLRRPIDALGVFVAPLGLTFLVASQFIHPAAVDPAISRGMLALHVSANVLGIALVFVAGAAALFYVVTERRLKQKRLVSVGRLPSLESLDLLEHRLLLLGFPLLTFGVVSGAMFFSALSGANPASILRAVLGYLTWAVVLGVLLSRAVWGWSGRRTAIGTLLGVLSLVLLVLVYMIRPLFGGAL